MPKGATLVNTARKEVIDEKGLMRALTEREDLKYVTDIAAGNQAALDEAFGKRVFATPRRWAPRRPRPTSMPVWPPHGRSWISSERATPVSGKQINGEYENRPERAEGVSASALRTVSAT